MGKIDRRSRCIANSVWVLSGIRSGTHADCTPNTFQTFETRGKTSRPEDRRITQKRGDRGSGTCREPVSLKHFHCSQKGWYQKTSHRSKAAKSICKKSSIQDGRFDSNTISPPEGGFPLQDRSSGCLPVDPCCRESKSIPLFSLEGETLSVHLPTFRTGFLTKNFCLKPLPVYLRALGVRLLVYLDDFLIMAHTRVQCLEQAQLIVGLLENLGYLINREKSVLEPTQRLEYLGFLIDTVEMKFFLPEMKILKIQNLAEKFLQEQISARQLASLLGLLQATLPAITIAPLYFRNLQRDLSKALNSSEGKQSYRTVVALSLESRGELMWWKNWLPFHNGKNFLVPKEQERFSQMPQRKAGELIWALRNRRTLVLGRANPAHKCSRTSSSFFSNKSLATQNRQATCSVCNRQPNCSNIHKQIR